MRSRASQAARPREHLSTIPHPHPPPPPDVFLRVPQKKMSVCNDSAHLNDLKRARRHSFERTQVVIRPARVRRTADVPGAAVVGHEHPVLLERGQDDLRLLWVSAYIEVRA